MPMSREMRETKDCKCHYPDAQRVGDIPELRIRLCYCVNHGYSIIQLADGEDNYLSDTGFSIMSESQREAERERMRLGRDNIRIQHRRGRVRCGSGEED